MLSKLWNRTENEVHGGGVSGVNRIETGTDQKVIEERIDHILEALWMAKEDGEDFVASSHFPISHLGNGHEDAFAHESPDTRAGTIEMEELVAQGLVERVDKSYQLTRTGEDRAKKIIRRHRLAELLLTEVLDADWRDQREVCRLEHGLSPKTADRICAFLGHPTTCPHGRPIPKGKCCENRNKQLAPLVEPLSNVEVGKDYRIVFITPKNHARLDRLSVLGVHPGSVLHLHQKRPTYVVRVGETDVALDLDIADDIFVKLV